MDILPKLIVSRLTRSELEREFGGRLSKNSIQHRDGAYVVVGKWCIIERVGDVWDIWVCNPNDIPAGLGQRKVNNIVRGFDFGPIAGRWETFDGEASTRVPDTDVILANTRLLGVRLKRQLSEAERKRLAEMGRRRA